MNIEPLKPRKTLSKQALEVIVQAIMTGGLLPGDEINEAEFARKLGVSRGPLREALSQLEGRQLLERIPGVGLRVIRLTRQDLIALFDIRSALESLACRNAAINMTDDEREKLKHYVGLEQGKAPKPASSTAYMTADDFHLMIVYGSRNDRLIKMLTGDLYLQMRLYRHQSGRRAPERMATAWAEHQEIVAAITARDPERAAQAMATHIQSAKEALLATCRANKNHEENQDAI